ncbi:OprD family outer membrane porin [Acinetobacter wanghuae]|uniref:OprD family outer membrane porin n=1 Tax=Acinetobacter wanghuae TaxID=2662362 RepID=UPI003AF5B2BA
MRFSTILLGMLASTVFNGASANTFIDQSSVSLTARNFYFDRDYTQASPSQRDWAQGFILKANSGYTSGQIGLGLDILALAGFNLLGNSNQDYIGSGLLPVYADNSRADQTGELRWTVKAKYQDSTLHIGTLTPMFPVLFASPARLFQQNYRGAHLQVNEIDNLKLHGIYVDRVNHRDSTNYEKIRVGNPNGRFESAAESSGLHMLGADYKIDDQATAQIYHANLHDIYQQHFLGLKTKYDIGIGNFLSDLRLFISEDSGDALAGHIENQHFSGIFGLNRSNHTFSLGYMQSFGDTALPTLSGSEPAVFLDSMSADFSNINEKVYHARYDYDFKDTPLNGLKFMTRYSKGVAIEIRNLPGQEFEQEAIDFDLSYRIPTGKLEGLNLRARHSHYRNDIPPAGMAFRSDDETRFNIDYTWTFK